MVLLLLRPPQSTAHRFSRFYSTCYQTVPVTTFNREKQTVEVPYYQTEYEDREYTVLRPVTRQREVEVQTVSYQNVTEYRTVNRDMGTLGHSVQPHCSLHPCQVDPRPGVIGWLNRTGYSLQTAFMPSYTTSRQYVPKSGHLSGALCATGRHPWHTKSHCGRDRNGGRTPH